MSEITKEILEKELKRCETVIQEKEKKGEGTSYWTSKVAEIRLLLRVIEKGYDQALDDFYNFRY